MRRPLLFLTGIMVMGTGSLFAQSSQFGVRGLGLPGRGVSVRALGTEGAASMFDPGSSHNPAALGRLQGVLTSFSTIQEWRTTTNPAGTGSTRQQRFPLLLIGGPVPGSKFTVGVSFSSFTNRDFLLLTNGTASPRGEPPIDVVDSLGSTGGLSDFRVAVAYRLQERVQLGVGLHLITGSNRLFSNRAWSDSNYISLRQSANLSYLGFGISGGALVNLSPRLQVAGMIRYNGSLSVERDSTEVGSTDMPIGLTAAVSWHPTARLGLSAQIESRAWSRSNDGIVALGGLGAASTLDISAGFEYLRSRRRPEQLPLRLGVRRTELPFLLIPGDQPVELGIAIGTGFRFARDIAGLDLSLERVHRSQGDDFSENAWHLSVGVSLRGVASN